MKKKNLKLYLLIALVIFFITIILSTVLGVANVSIIDTIKIIGNSIPVIGSKINISGIDDVYKNIILNIRLPRIILAGLAGIGLSISGTAYQSLFKNPMADPYILGVSSGAALGATASIVLGFGSTLSGISGTTILAFLGSLITIALVYGIAKVGNKTPVTSLILAGVSISYLFSAMISIIMIFNKEQLDRIVFWLMGSLSTSSWKQVLVLLPIIVITGTIIWIYSKDLNVILSGEETALSLGIDIEKTKIIVLIAVSMIVASIVSMTGIIGFVGLIIPHTVRMIIGANNRRIIPFVAIYGGIFLIISDTIARNIAPPSELPIGAVTSLFGAPYFIYLLIKSKKKVI